MKRIFEQLLSPADQNRMKWPEESPGFYIDAPYEAFVIPVSALPPNPSTATEGSFQPPDTEQLENVAIRHADVGGIKSRNLPHWIRSTVLVFCLLFGAFAFWKSGYHRELTQDAVARESSPIPLDDEHRWELKSIADFEVGDLVMAYNHETGEMEQSRVIETYERTSDHLRLLTFRNLSAEFDEASLTIETTDEHPFWSQTRLQYVEAGDLLKGELFHTADGQRAYLVETIREEHPEGVSVYNLEVEGLHNYFVTSAASGANGDFAILAHNADYSGGLVKVNNPDPAADALAIRIGGQSSMKFANDIDGREFDAISSTFIAQTKPALRTISSQFRKQARETFAAAKQTGRQAYFHFDGQPAPEILRKLEEYSRRFGVGYVVDTVPL